MFANHQNLYTTVFSCLILLLLNSCSSTKQLSKSLHKQVEESVVFSKSFTGFALYDPVKKEWLANQWADRYFTPASNTKIFTLYASMTILGDRIPALQYQVKQDSLIFWGTGHPGFLHPDLPADSSVYLLFKEWTGPIFFSSSNFLDQRYGSGWAWDDYPYSFQPEKSPFPIYGNVVTFTNNGQAKPETAPSFFESYLKYIPGGSWVQRDESGNRFSYNGRQREGLTRRIPFQYSDSLFVQLLSKALERPIFLLEEPLLPDSTAQFFYSSQAADSIYQLMMQQSDNFIAEQLLLSCASKLNNLLQTKPTINFVKDSLNPTGAELIWVDGSGLSRYNMFTPRSIVQVLEELWNSIDRERLLNIFPAGGESGTIEPYYIGTDGPYIFAKTGTLRHNHCLSGYLRTRSGKWLIFSFMNNHYSTGSGPLKTEMEKVLKKIYEEY